MSRKSGLKIKIEILAQLKQKDRSLRELESKVNTNSLTIKAHCKELEYFGLVTITKVERNQRNGRPFTKVSITPAGRRF